MSVIFIASKSKKNLTRHIKRVKDQFEYTNFIDISNEKNNSSIFLFSEKEDYLKLCEFKDSFTLIKGNYSFIDNEESKLSDKYLYKNLKGNFLIFQYFNHKFFISTDSMLSIPLFRFENEEYICFSNSIELIMLLIPKKWEIVWNQVFSFVANSSCAGDGTFIKDIFLATPGTQYIFDNKQKIEKENFWNPPLISENKTNEKSIKNLAEILINNIFINMKNSDKVAIPLTAGVDSRLILACALKLFPDKVIAFTHGFEHSQEPDIEISKLICRRMKVQHNFIDCTNKIKRIVNDNELIGKHHLLTFGQARHSFLFDILLYESYKNFGCDLELKGLAGGLFKGKWQESKVNKFPIEILEKYQLIFEENFKGTIFRTPSFFSRISIQDFTNISKESIKNYSIFFTRYVNRVSPRTNFQSELFNSINPFYDFDFIYNYLKINTESRRMGMIHLKLINYIYPELLEFPYLASREYYQYKDQYQIKLSNTKLREIGINPYVKNKNSYKHKIMKFLLNESNINIKKIKPTADWDHVKNCLNPYINLTFQKFNSYFPGILKKFSVSKILSSKDFDSRLYRLYSSLCYLCYLKEKDVKFKSSN